MKPTNWVYILVVTTTIITMDKAYSSTNAKQVPQNTYLEQQTLETLLNKPSSYQENIAKLLLAEIALQNNNSTAAIDNYIEIIKAYKDPTIAELALECAIKYKEFDKAVEIALLWADFATTDINPQIIAATLVLDSLPGQAKIYIARAIKIDPNEIDQFLLLTYKKLPSSSQKNLYAILEQLVKENPKDPYIYIAAAQIAAQEDEILKSTKFVEQALKLQPNLTHAIQLKAKLIRHKTNKDLPALTYLHKEILKNPNDEELRMFYGNALLDNNNIAEALPYLQNLTKSKTYGMEAQFILGELFVEQQKYTKAYNMLINVIQDPAYGSSAKYNLGQICEQQNKPKDAIKWYSEIKEGQFHIPATLKAAMLLAMEHSEAQALQLVQEATPTTFIEQKQLLLVELDLLVALKDTEHALKIINEAIALVPSDIDFLYARSLIASLLNIPEQAEKDLQTILSIEPEHANALNALGYTLSNQPERTKEAITYLKKALELSPDNPAFMDSMGWVLFRIGKIQDSIGLLKDAYNLSKDSEIAAHLGEALWTTGKKEQARKIWHEALQNNPNHDILLETLNRLNVQLSLPGEKSPNR